ncbi:MAG: hypothetical protein IJ281_08705 [Clostridia bacterium]|nr:hypothetical protein [Clostridia bacterium]
MKQLVKILCVMMALVCIGAALAGCAKTLSGTYKAEVMGSGAAYTFKGHDVEVKVLVLGTVMTTLNGTYELGDGTITLTFGEEEGEEAGKYSGTFAFSQTEDKIKIGVVEYTRAEN